MKNSMLKIAVLASVLVVIFSGNVRAQLLLDQAVGGSAGVATELGNAAHTPADAATIMQNLLTQGYSNISASPADSHQFKATTPDGMNVLLTVEPITGKILSAVPQ